ncbi:MAG: tail fiber domain-containing protein [Cyanobium sp.]
MGRYGTDLTGFGAFEGGVNADKGAPLVSTSSDGETALLFGPAALREIQAGVANGDFAIPPDAAGDTITEENPLPYWTFTDVNSAGAITCAVVADASAGSGNVLRWTINTGTLTGKSAQISRYIPIATSRDRALTIVPDAYVSEGIGTNAQFKLTYSYVKQDLTTTGTGATGTPRSIAGSIGASPTTAPSDAAYVYVVITLETTGTTAALTGDLAEVKLRSFFSAFFITDNNDSATYAAAAFEQGGGNLLIGANGGTGNTGIVGTFSVSGNATFSSNIGVDGNIYFDTAITGPYINQGGTNGRIITVANATGTSGVDLVASTASTRSGILITKSVAGQPTTNLNGTGTTDAFADILRNGGLAVDTTNSRLYAYAGGAWKYAALTTPSDSRLKEEITEITGALDTLRQLMPVAFKWKRPEAHPHTDAVGDDGTRRGFIADQVATTDLKHWVEDMGVSELEADLIETDGRILAVNIPQNEMEALVVQALLDIDARLKALESR